MEVLGVRIDNLSKKEILEKIEGFLREEKFHQIVTVNPEFILQAQADADFKKILDDTDLNIADGVGIKFSFWRFGKNLKARIAGVDLMEEILQIADKNKYKIFLVANSGGLSTWEETRAAILQKYPRLEINGVNVDKNSTNYQLPTTNSDIVFCVLGAPHQEELLHSLKSLKNSKIKLGMGVGGSFDFLTGRTRRAPKLMRDFGLEWLFRFMLEPGYRCKRIFRAVIIFPIKILIN